jgi:hypothetical protein
MSGKCFLISGHASLVNPVTEPAAAFFAVEKDGKSTFSV